MSVLFANNALSTLAGAINSTALSATLAPGTGALFPNPTGGDYFMMTFTDAATGLVNEIVKVTALSGDTVTIVRGQEGTAAASWNAGDGANNLITAGALATFVQTTNARVRLTSNLDLYVNVASGNDSTGTGSSGEPWQTPQHASDYIQQNLDLGAQWVVTVHVTGTTTTALTVNGPYFGAAGPASVIFTGPSGTTPWGFNTVATSVTAIYGAQFNLANCATASSASFGVASFWGGSLIQCNNHSFGACAIYHQVVNEGGGIQHLSGYAITGTVAGQNHLSASSNGVINMGVPVVGSGSLNFTTFIDANLSGTVQGVGFSYTGAAVTGQRYNCTNAGGVNSGGGGANFFPGDSAGVATSPGYYN